MYILVKATLYKEEQIVEINVQPASPQTYPPLRPSGLGGWLVLVQIGLVATLFQVSLQLINYNIPSFGREYWDLLASPQGEMNHPLWAPAFIFEAAANGVLLLLTIFTLILFYQKKARLPRMMILLYSVNLLIGIIDYVLVMNIPVASELQDGSSMRDLIRAVFTCALWTAYFRKSERVRYTFIH
ncbi:hypothetical protein C162_31384 [Paenibacillus sp. FSL R7-269]|nr:hypothetical protein C162_31384 [Paenibacillus sp. FSL R7-269]